MSRNAECQQALASPHPQLYPLPELEEGAQFVLPEFTFDLDEAAQQNLPTFHKALRHEIKISPRLYFERLDRVDPECQLERSYTVSFPVELETVNCPNSLVQGRTNKQQWKVHNHTDRFFPPPGRKVLVDLALQDQGAGLLVTDEQGHRLALEASGIVLAEIQPIPPKKSVTLTVYLHPSEEAEPYSKATLTAGLRLTPQGGGVPRLIQQNPTRYTVALTHQECPADILLVTHPGNHAEEIKAWRELLSSLNLSHNFWDVSLHGEFPLKKLATWYEGKLVVVLNTPFLTPHRETIFPLELACLNEFRETVSKHGVSYYVIGEKTDILNHLVPQPPEVRTFESPSDYLRRGKLRIADMTDWYAQIAVYRFFFKGNPRPDYLLETARKLLDKLRKKSPQDRFHITTIFEPDDNQGWLRTRRCGLLEVRRLTDHDARSVVTRQVYRETGRQSSFLHSSENLLGLFSSLDMDDKIALVQKMQGQPDHVLEALADAVLLDLSEEQLDLRRSEVRLGKKKMREALNRTVEFCQHDFGRAVAHESGLGKVLIRVAAGLEFLADRHLAWWDHRIRFVFGSSNNVEITNFTRDAIDGLLDRTFGRDWLIGTSALRKQVEALMDQREAELEKQHKTIAQAGGERISDKEAAAEALVRWELRDFLASGAESDSKLCSQQELEELKDQENTHHSRLQMLKNVYIQAIQAGEVTAI
ncbi:MAG: hypothetical protein WC314_23825 [Vulcanimicrobiota bacterium]